MPLVDYNTILFFFKLDVFKKELKSFTMLITLTAQLETDETTQITPYAFNFLRSATFACEFYTGSAILCYNNPRAQNGSMRTPYGVVGTINKPLNYLKILASCGYSALNA